jgi:DnaJ-domain-containing protein 1
VREYNKSWNFCNGLSEAQIEALIRADTQWERQTRPTNGWRAHEQKLRDAVHGFESGAAGKAQDEPRKSEQFRGESHSPEAKALRVFGLTPPVDYMSIKSRYIELVKRHHPDANGGDKAAEERLKTINQALQTLKASYPA